MRPLAALVFLLAAPALAGCAGGPEDVQVADPPRRSVGEVPASDLEAGRPYAFRHAGGTVGLAVAADGDVRADLFAGDQRVGGLALGDGRPLSGSFPQQPAGELVLWVHARNGTLAVRSGGSDVAGFSPLRLHTERHILVQDTAEGLPELPVPGASELPPTPLQVDLERAPVLLQLLASGDHEGLTIVLRSPAGPVLETNASSAPFLFPSLPRSLPFFGAPALFQVPALFHGSNVEGTDLEGEVSAQSFDGALVLQSWSFSRAQPLAPPEGAREGGGEPEFVYTGEATGQPARFAVAAGASEVVLGAEEATWVALWGPDDGRIATVRLDGERPVRIPVMSAGDHVVAAWPQPARVGADRAPQDFELHPLEVREAWGPDHPAGADGRYGQETTTLEAPGVLFAIEPAATQQGFAFCSASGSLRVSQDGETVAFWDWDGATPGTWPEASPDDSAPLSGGALELAWDGIGDGGCSYPGVRALAFVRPAAA